MLIEGGLNDFEDFSPVPPGKYEFVIKEPVKVEKVEGEQTDIGGQLYKFTILPEVVGGDSAGKKVPRKLTNRSKASRYFLRTFLEKIGVSITAGGGFATEDVLGRRFSASVGERTYKDQDGNEKKAAELDEGSIVAI